MPRTCCQADLLWLHQPTQSPGQGRTGTVRAPDERSDRKAASAHLTQAQLGSGSVTALDIHEAVRVHPGELPGRSDRWLHKVALPHRLPNCGARVEAWPKMKWNELCPTPKLHQIALGVNHVAYAVESRQVQPPGRWTEVWSPGDRPGGLIAVRWTRRGSR
jgi:hypothetical protein